ncbi:hypothetical protein QR680_015256 [Steinernema hermaphroditum]|uniref:U5 small nuclear ribonucleoprotein 40 kDa protein n=1 Tax=Steinernema hermaphroditum TaxID=289476 RepID=A0AA39LKI9_9BILA|nr:hypothetical protein QR680_015256 [Steinernema hermaphroditum]
MAAMESFKRPALPGSLVPVSGPKRARLDEGAVMLAENAHLPPRSSNLQAPIMCLSGHEGEIYTSRFSSDGSCLASAGFDQKILLWNVFGDCENFSHFRGHTGAVMDLHFNADDSHLFSCSTDKTVRVWDMETGVCNRKFKSHKDIVNACFPARRGPELVVSASDDGCIFVHDVRKRNPVMEFKAKYPTTAVTFNDTTEQIISGGIDNEIIVWDMRRKEAVYMLSGHQDTITGLSLSPDGSFVLSNSMDCTVKQWDIRPFCNSPGRCVSTYVGHQHNFEKNLLKCAWSPDGKRVAAGSADRFTYVWDITTRRIIYKLPGHHGSVNAVDFHPHESIMLSAGSDKRIYLGELEPVI